MRVSGTHHIPAPPVEVFAALLNPDVLARCIEGCERLVRVDSETFEADLRLGIGPVRGNYRGAARISELREPESLVLTVDGKGPTGFVHGRAAMRLAPAAEGTDLTCEADAQVGGLIATVGGRFLDAAARQMLDRFFRALETQLAR